MSRAASYPQSCLLALVETEGNAERVRFARDESEMQQMIESLPGSPLVYNQHECAVAFVEAQALVDGQYTIEVFQETEGVFGLRAYLLDGKMQRPEILEFRE